MTPNPIPPAVECCKDCYNCYFEGMHKASYPNTVWQKDGNKLNNNSKCDLDFSMLFNSQFLIQNLDNILWPEVQTVSSHFYHEYQLNRFDKRNQHIQAYSLDQIMHYQVLSPFVCFTK